MTTAAPSTIERSPSAASFVAPAPRKRNDIASAQALVIEPNAMARSVVCNQLRDMGVGVVHQASRITDARLKLEQDAYDIVLCSRDFDDPDVTGQDLVDELRREQLLPHSTVFIMITSEATYAKVTEAGEASLDGFLLRPYTAATLAERILEARRRKETLADLLGALATGDLPRATRLSLDRYHRNMPYAPYAARVAAELLLRQGNAKATLELCEDVERKAGSSWARLGIVRAHLHRGDLGTARRICDALIASRADDADAHDALGRIHLEHGDIDKAFAAYRRSVELTPGCLLRLQACGSLAFYAGDRQGAMQWLDRSVSLGIRSRLFDALTLMLLVLLRYDERNTKALVAAHEQLLRHAQRQEGSPRLECFDRAARALRHLAANELDAAQDCARELSAVIESDAGDLESAVVALAVWARLPDRDISAGELEKVAKAAGHRFCVSRSMTELLVSAAATSDQLRSVVRACQQELASYVETSMTHALESRPDQAVRALLDRGKTWRNAKLLEMATLVARRHAASLQDCDALVAESNETMARVCHPVHHIAGIRQTGRSAGGLILRT